MSRLSTSTHLPPHVLGTDYDRSALEPGILHMGLGAFHRAHQAVYTQRALSRSFGPWGIVAVNLRSSEPVEALAAQDGLYSVVVRKPEGDSVEVVGPTVDWLCAAERRSDVLDYLAREDIRIVTLTVSEKAYGLNPVTGGLDRDHPAIRADLSNPQAPVGVIGFLVEGLSRRRDKGLLPFTVLSCDNLPSNGQVVRRLVLEMAEIRDTDLARWIEEKGKFPSSMVDRIVPAATDDSRARASTLLGADDALSIETEPFLQWVIEDEFVSGRPDWEAGGAVFARSVEPYEKMKLRLLNGAHTMIAHLGILHDLDYVRDVMAETDFVTRVRNHMQAAAKTLDPVPGIDLPAYMDELLARFANPYIAHRNVQIAMDTSQKLPQRILAAAAETLKAGGDGEEFAYAVALWIASIRKRGNLDDPRRTDILAAAEAMDAHDPSAPFFATEGLFAPELVANRGWRDLVNRKLFDLLLQAS